MGNILGITTFLTDILLNLYRNMKRESSIKELVKMSIYITLTGSHPDAKSK